MKFVQITDTHIVPPGLLLWGLDPRERLEACIADINAHHGDAELCVITGDLVHKGEAGAYEVLRECLSALRLPYYLMIGNHDDREAFRHAFPNMECDKHGFVQNVVETRAGRFILCDTHEPGLIGEATVPSAGRGSHGKWKSRETSRSTCSCTTSPSTSGSHHWTISGSATRSTSPS